MDLTARTGEPYCLAGSRMAFTNWYYVRPSGLGWFNDKGEDVTVKGNDEPGQAHIHSDEPAIGICLIVNPAQRSGQIIMPRHAYEDGGWAVSTIIEENGIYRVWANTGWGDLKNRGMNFFCYYESDDGINWKAPNCGIYEFEGNRDNNILSADGGGNVFIDASASPSERYKWIREHQFSREEYENFLSHRPGKVDARCVRQDVGVFFGAQGAVSPEGLRWTIIDEPLVMMHTDTHIVAYYDAQLGKYVGYFRDWMVGPQAGTYAESNDKESITRWLRCGRRVIGRAETKDFRHWPISEVILEPHLAMSPNEVLYTNCKTTIPKAPDNHLMFPAVWDISTDRTHLVLATSHNGRYWNYTPGRSVLETAPFEQWDGGCVFAVPNLIELPNGDFALPYTGYNVPHKYPRKKATRGFGYAIWPKGRLIGIEAKDKGSFTTAAVISQGRKLLINAEVEKDGYIEVEAADLQGRSIVGRDFGNSVRLTGDCFEKPVVWKGYSDLGIQKGEPIMLRFRLKNATVYYLDFEQ